MKNLDNTCMIKTTVNIRVDLRNKIIAAAVSGNISVNELIVRLITYAKKYSKIPIVMFSRVHYQARSEGNEWESQHVSWRVDEYEKFQDLRRLWKLSVSFILGIAIERYLNECIADHDAKNSIKNSDNNPVSYVFISNFDQENEFFVIFWKYPPPPLLEKFNCMLPHN